MATQLYYRDTTGLYRSKSPIQLGTVLFEEQPIATLQENPTQAEVLQAVNQENLQIFDQLPISSYFRNAMPPIDPAIARYKSNRLRRGTIIIGNTSVEAFGIFPHIASFPPSCAPNVHLRWAGDRMELRAAVNIPANAVLKISRDIDWILRPRDIRHGRLSNIYGINCQCRVGAGTPHEIDQSNRTRALISPVVSGQLDPQRDSELQIKAALDQLWKEGLYIYRDTLLYDLYKLYHNNAMLSEAHECLREARRLASAYVGEDDPRVLQMANYPN